LFHVLFERHGDDGRFFGFLLDWFGVSSFVAIFVVGNHSRRLAFFVVGNHSWPLAIRSTLTTPRSLGFVLVAPPVASATAVLFDFLAATRARPTVVGPLAVSYWSPSAATKLGVAVVVIGFVSDMVCWLWIGAFQEASKTENYTRVSESA
jgi:hypothetical protein